MKFIKVFTDSNGNNYKLKTFNSHDEMSDSMEDDYNEVFFEVYEFKHEGKKLFKSVLLYGTVKEYIIRDILNDYDGLFNSYEDYEDLMQNKLELIKENYKEIVYNKLENIEGEDLQKAKTKIKELLNRRYTYYQKLYENEDKVFDKYMAEKILYEVRIVINSVNGIFIKKTNESSRLKKRMRTVLHELNKSIN
jgi:hypothetical protein